MLIDEVDIILKAGDGGAGKVSFTASSHGGPDGGNGGKGGDIYLEGVSDLTALNQFSKRTTILANRGEAGGSNQKNGKDADAITLKIPVGCELTEEKTNELIKIDRVGERVLVCKGGIGGRGNYRLRSSSRTTPTYAQNGLPGEQKNLSVSLKLIADFGLIGLPNVGKSSLLNELTKANVKVGDYSFTTLEPNLGVLKNKVFADIPGLIAGASVGKGLGILFLKHIEKVSLLLHCISATSTDVVENYNIILNELKSYNVDLIKKPQIVLLTQSDLVSKVELDKKVEMLKETKKKILPISIYDWDSLQNLIKLLKI